MTSERRVAVAVGALYIVATVAGALAAAMLGSLLEGPEALTDVAGHEKRMLATACFELVMALAVGGVAFMIHPILERDADTTGKRGLALWYVGSRVTESALLLVGAVFLLSLLTLSRDVAGAGISNQSQYLATFGVLKSASDHAIILGQSVFSVGAVMLSYLLYVSRRVPRWLSVWGLVGAPLMLVGGLSIAVTNDPNSTVSSVLYAPLGLQEMVLAAWLILRGFTVRQGEGVQ